MRAMAKAGRLGLALGILLAGCDRDPRLPAGVATQDVGAAITHLPARAWALVGVRPARARAVPALAALLARLPALPIEPGLARTCGLSPTAGDAAIDLAVAAIGGADAGDRAVAVALSGSFTRASIARCAVERTAGDDEPLAATDDGRLTAYAPRPGARRGGGAAATGPTHAYWPTDRILVVAPLGDRAPAALTALAAVDPTGLRPDARESGPRQAARGGDPAPPGLADLVSRVRTDAALWAAGRLPPPVEARLRAAGPGVAPVRGFFAWLDPGGAGRIDLLLGLRLATAEEAEATADALAEQREALTAALADPRLRAIAARVEIVRAGADVAGRASLSPDELAHLVGLVAP